ncbi:DNA (cytosine-5)-methyltransferase CMT3 isoform X2 [Olea europaea var. sylvestris]|uniref:DNA (cytosine-5)-methyltransferase CMT3 isoform X2 n=1 Tax=Olea europaea var. sylvestris TaxID=158386 RepID=UPI000C1D3C42|nr:DNA (cytosine-5)-methyltransferase CMT3 isoform X2 [Olea europaea var. sylvestris]
MPSKRKLTSEDAAASEGSKRSGRQASNMPDNDVALELDSVTGSGGVIAEEEGVGEVLQNGSSENISKLLDLDLKQKDRIEVEEDEEEAACRFVGDPVADEEARQLWPHRYNASSEVIRARRHFTQAEVDGQLFNLEDEAYVKADEGQDNFICKIIEMFEAVDGSNNFTARWYYRANDTVIKCCDNFIDDKRVFFSEIKDDNPLDCLVRKLKIVNLPIKDGSDINGEIRSKCDYYYDQMYLLPYTSFVSLQSDNSAASSESCSTISSDADVAVASSFGECPGVIEQGREKTLLDLYSGCGAMSTGLCLGVNSCGVNLVTKWAVDLNQFACESLKLNHPETEVRNESAEDFLNLLKEWEKLCASHLSTETSGPVHENRLSNSMENDESDDNGSESGSETFEVAKILSICYGDPNKSGKSALYFKIRWKGYGPEEDTWEPLEGLSDCEEKLKEFVFVGYKAKILPMPGDVDVICGGPPCQGISGFNRFRNKENPLDDDKNKQLIVFMDIVAFLKPKFVLMENVVDIVKFAGGFLGRYAIGRLVGMGYQARMGMMAAGAYGLPQFRMRVFVWGALSTELPQYPLPTHNVVVRGVIPTEFEANTVAYSEGSKIDLKKELFLGDAISDLPPVENDEARDEIPYGFEPETDFQRFIRLRRDEMPGCLMFNSEVSEHKLYDHQPYLLNQDDFQRVCHIPKKKGANFRDLPGVRVRADNKVEFDPDIERVKLPSGKPLVPDYAMTFVRGTSSKPFGRLWWDETVPTVVTRAEPHNQTIVHPVQDRVLTIRENARLQGFPDYYKLLGPIKERYIQVGNAVAVPVARALGYSLALALKGLSGTEPLFTLPEEFPKIADTTSPTSPEVHL